jgi:glyoxylase-like metal-dependent hydrolase (beta-lactamase superfamily II)
MRVEEIESDVLMFVGDAYESVATAFLCDGDALLIDTLASHADAEWMRRSLDQMGKTVRTVIATHYERPYGGDETLPKSSDHRATLFSVHL